MAVERFYDEYYGHRLDDLEVVHAHLRAKQPPGGGIIWLAGDSSLDNKHWFKDKAPAAGPYAEVLRPPTSVMDVAHCLNVEAASRGLPLVALNCAVEESRIQSRACGQLMKHDIFLRDHVTRDDIVVVSVGGNDIALHPTLCTILNMLCLICCTTPGCIDSCSCGCSCPVDDCCWGCGAGCCSVCLACPPGMGYFVNLFGARVQAYVERLIAGKAMPKKVLICMIYYPDEKATGGWADFTLAALGYNANPTKLQSLIRQVFRLATQRISIPGTELVAVPLFEALDGKHTEDYEQRVEPSAKGGVKMARLILDACVGGGVSSGGGGGGGGSPGEAQPLKGAQQIAGMAR